MPPAKPEITTLSFHQPFDFRQITGFLKPRAIPGVEYVDTCFYSRTVSLGGTTGFFTVSCPGPTHASVHLEIHFPDQDKWSLITTAVKSIFDLDAPSLAIDDHLKRDRFLSSLVERRPGIRVPGSFNSFELAIRAIIGQQISVKGATTLIHRIAKRFGEKLSAANALGLKYLFPGPDKLVDADYEGIGLTKARIATIRKLSAALLDGQIDFHTPGNPDHLSKTLQRIKGIGPWTAQYILMRTIKHADAMPYSDLGLLKAISPDGKPAAEKQLKEMSMPWKPWRAYAAMHLWATLADH